MEKMYIPAWKFLRIILGAGLVGTELSIYLQSLGYDVQIVEMADTINDGGNSCQKRAVEDQIIQRKIPIHFNTKAVEITDKGIRCQGPDGEVFYECDTVAYAAGMRERTDEALSFYDAAPIFHMIGDCRFSSTIFNATSSGYTVARWLGRYE